jgi:hypothetical protein
LALVGKPFNDVGSSQNLDTGFRKGLALLLRQQARDVGSAFAHQASGLAHGIGALVGRNISPRPEAALRCSQGAVQIGNPPRVPLCRWTGPWAGLLTSMVFSACGIAPSAIDEQAGVGIGWLGHGNSFGP